MGKDHGDVHDYLPLFETKSAKSRTQFRLFVGTMIVGICSIFVYRLRYMPLPAIEEVQHSSSESNYGLGLDCFSLSFGSLFIGSSQLWSDGIPYIVALSKTG